MSVIFVNLLNVPNEVCRVPENLFESDLFGHERGSFTGALERKLGKFELADGGTLFLDEIGCMPPAMQAKLLRVLEGKAIERVGGEKVVPIDVRLISATNIDFKKEITEGNFRHDLYYRLNVIPVTLTPLRERNSDIPLFVEYFINKFNNILNKNVKGLAKEAMAKLLNYPWPGNVRELQNLIERVIVLSAGKTICEDEIPLSAQGGTKPLKESLDNFEIETIKKVIAENNGNISQAARSLKTARTTLLTRIKALGIQS